MSATSPTRTSDPILKKMREICLSLPDTKETLTWGHPHFRVGEKIFSGYGEEDGKSVIGFKLEMDHAAAIVSDPRFWRAPYVGHKGWVSMDVSKVSNWDEVRFLVRESYRLIAPKRSLAKLAPEAAAAAPKKKPAKVSAKKVSAKKPAKVSANKVSAKKPAKASAKKPAKVRAKKLAT